MDRSLWDPQAVERLGGCTVAGSGSALMRSLYVSIVHALTRKALRAFDMSLSYSSLYSYKIFLQDICAQRRILFTIIGVRECPLINSA